MRRTGAPPSDSGFRVCAACWEASWLYRNRHLVIANNQQHVIMMMIAMWVIVVDSLVSAVSKRTKILRSYLSVLKKWIMVILKIWMLPLKLFLFLPLMSIYRLLFLRGARPRGRHNQESSPTHPSFSPGTADPGDCDACQLRQLAVEAFAKLDNSTEGLNPGDSNVESDYAGIDGYKVTVATVASSRDESNDGRFELDITTSPGQDLSWLGYKQTTDISDHSSSAECFEKIRTWSEDCLNNHAACSKPAKPAADTIEGPARLIDTGPLEGDVCLKLVSWPRHEKSKTAKYCALSYSWGKDPDMHFTTTAETYEERSHGFQMAQLPQTLQDAVVITRKVGCRYLWIDALCIIQRDRADWESESPRMHYIYGNAFLVIAATENASPGDGIFASRPPAAHFEFRRADKSYQISVRERDNHGPWRHRTRIVGSQPVPRQPALHTRAWAYQERLLATRIVHYTVTELVWECNTHCRCECSLVQQTDRSNAYDTGRSLKSQFAIDSGLNHRNGRSWWNWPTRRKNQAWKSVIEHYSVKELTVQADKLPALAGLARQFSTPEMGKYLAGIWYSQLPDALAWEVCREPEPGVYRAPSWCWASLDGEVQGIERARFTDGVTCVEVLDAGCTPAGDDIFGAVSDGYIVLKGYFGPLNSSQIGESDELWVMKVKSYGWSLVLKRSERVSGAWERVLGRYERVSDKVFEGRGKTVITIV